MSCSVRIGTELRTTTSGASSEENIPLPTERISGQGVEPLLPFRKNYAATFALNRLIVRQNIMYNALTPSGLLPARAYMSRNYMTNSTKVGG